MLRRCLRLASELSLPKAAEILGVGSGASQKQVKDAYMKLTLHHHPDRHLADPEAVQMHHRDAMAQVNAAYERLKSFTHVPQFGDGASTFTRINHTDDPGFQQAASTFAQEQEVYAQQQQSSNFTSYNQAKSRAGDEFSWTQYKGAKEEKKDNSKKQQASMSQLFPHLQDKFNRLMVIIIAMCGVNIVASWLAARIGDVSLDERQKRGRRVGRMEQTEKWRADFQKSSTLEESKMFREEYSKENHELEKWLRAWRLQYAETKGMQPRRDRWVFVAEDADGMANRVNKIQDLAGQRGLLLPEEFPTHPAHRAYVAPFPRSSRAAQLADEPRHPSMENRVSTDWRETAPSQTSS